MPRGLDSPSCGHWAHRRWHARGQTLVQDRDLKWGAGRQPQVADCPLVGNKSFTLVFDTRRHPRHCHSSPPCTPLSHPPVSAYAAREWLAVALPWALSTPVSRTSLPERQGAVNGGWFFRIPLSLQLLVCPSLSLPPTETLLPYIHTWLACSLGPAVSPAQTKSWNSESQCEDLPREGPLGLQCLAWGSVHRVVTDHSCPGRSPPIHGLG